MSIVTNGAIMHRIPRSVGLDGPLQCVGEAARVSDGEATGDGQGEQEKIMTGEGRVGAEGNQNT